MFPLPRPGAEHHPGPQENVARDARSLQRHPAEGRIRPAGHGKLRGHTGSGGCRRPPCLSDRPEPAGLRGAGKGARRALSARENGEGLLASRFQVAPVSGSLGLKVTGIDLKGDLDDSVVAELRQLLLTRLALFFPGQFLSHTAQQAFAERFGEIQRHPDRAEWVDGTDQKIVIVSPKGGVSSVWHCDYDEDFVPCGFSMLNMVRTAADGGGDTIFVNDYAIYEQLSAPMRHLFDGLTAIHRNIGNSKRKRDTAEFPLVGTHPETGRKGLLYSAHHVVGFVELPQSE